MIKYNIKLNSSHLITEAIESRAFIELDLSGMYCQKCKTDTQIDFTDGRHGQVDFIIVACCDDFERRIKDKLNL